MAQIPLPLGQASAHAVATAFAVANPLSAPGWDAHVSQFPGVSPFHTVAWARVLAETYAFVPHYLTFSNGSRKAVIPLMQVRPFFGAPRAVGLPFSDFVAPLASDPVVLKDLFSALIEHGRMQNWHSLELRGAQSMFDAEPASADFVTHDLDLTSGPEVLWKGIHSSHQRAVRKAEAAGVLIRRETSFEAMKAFYALQCRTRRKHGLPPQSFGFFAAIHRNVIATGEGAIYLAASGGRTIAAAVFLHGAESVFYKYGASDERSLQVRPNHLLMWRAISDYAGQGVATMNFGRTEPDNEGLRRYKLGFGACERTVRYHKFLFPSNRFAEPAQGRVLPLVRGVFRHLPLPVARLLGAALYRFAA